MSDVQHPGWRWFWDRTAGGDPVIVQVRATPELLATTGGFVAFVNGWGGRGHWVPCDHLDKVGVWGPWIEPWSPTALTEQDSGVEQAEAGGVA